MIDQELIVCFIMRSASCGIRRPTAPTQHGRFSGRKDFACSWKLGRLFWLLCGLTAIPLIERGATVRREKPDAQFRPGPMAAGPSHVMMRPVVFQLPPVACDKLYP